MALIINDPETERLAHDLARLTGKNIATAMRRAVEEELRRVVAHSRKDILLEELAEIRRRWSAIPVIDGRTPEQILRYDERGLPR